MIVTVVLVTSKARCCRRLTWSAYSLRMEAASNPLDANACNNNNNRQQQQQQQTAATTTTTAAKGGGGVDRGGLKVEGMNGCDEKE